MNVRPITNEQDYLNAIIRINLLWGSKKDTSEGDELGKLVTLVELFEIVHYPIVPLHIKNL